MPRVGDGEARLWTVGCGLRVGLRALACVGATEIAIVKSDTSSDKFCCCRLCVGFGSCNRQKEKTKRKWMRMRMRLRVKEMRMKLWAGSTHGLLNWVAGQCLSRQRHSQGKLLLFLQYFYFTFIFLGGSTAVS